MLQRIIELEGITLWLVPSSEDAVKLKKIMNVRPQDSVPTSPLSYPSFEPHITLAALPSSSEISMETIRSSVPSSQTRPQIEFKSIDIGSHFFRSVYLSVVPSLALQSLHQHVHRTLGIEPRTPLFPHISLCYISDEDADAGEREKFLQELETSGRVKRDGNSGVSLNASDTEEVEWLSGFSAYEIWIVDCQGPVEGWQVLGKITLV